MTKHLTAVAVHLAAISVLVAGCGSGGASVGGGPSSSGGSGSSASKGSTALTVGVGSTVYTAPFTTSAFTDAGLSVTQKTIASGAAAIPLLLNGQFQFIEGDAVGALIAISKGAPLVIVGPVTSSATTAEADNTGIFVTPDSPIRSAADLAGKKVAVNALGGGAQLVGEASIDKLGGDSGKVQFVEVPPTAIVSSIQKGIVDAGVTTGPIPQLRSVLPPLATATPGAPQIVYVTTKAYAASHRSVVASFAAAAAKADEHLASHPDEVRKITVDTLPYKLPPQTAATMPLPQFTPATIKKPLLQQLVDLMTRYKILTKPVDLGTAVFTP